MNTTYSTVFLLIRKISPYSGENILLGIFLNRVQAQEAQSQYIGKYDDNPEQDPWRKQSYKNPMVLKEDVVIQKLNTNAQIRQGNLVYFVSSYLDVLGQIYKKIDSLYIDKKSAREKIIGLEASENCSYTVAQFMLIGNLHTDDPSAEPHKKYFQSKDNIIYLFYKNTLN